MFNIIGAYINKLSKEDINKFALSKGATLSSEEIDFTYEFIKKNWKDVLKNPAIFDIERYGKYYQKDNFIKVKQVFNEYKLNLK